MKVSNKELEKIICVLRGLSIVKHRGKRDVREKKPGEIIKKNKKSMLPFAEIVPIKNLKIRVKCH